MQHDIGTGAYSDAPTHAACTSTPVLPFPAPPRTEVPNDPIVRPENWMGAFGDRAYAEKAFKDPLVS